MISGRYDEINKLLGQSAENEAALKQLMGNNRTEYERKLKEKLARRQKRIEQGINSSQLKHQLCATFYLMVLFN